MYPTIARRQARINELPVETWSPFLGRVTRWSVTQHRIASVAVNHPELSQRAIAERVGCAQGTVSKALSMMRRLGVLVVRTTRGRFGRTLARIRDGARRMIPPQVPVGIGSTDIRLSAQESFARGGASLADILRGMSLERATE